MEKSSLAFIVLSAVPWYGCDNATSGPAAVVDDRDVPTERARPSPSHTDDARSNAAVTRATSAVDSDEADRGESTDVARQHPGLAQPVDAPWSGRVIVE